MTRPRQFDEEKARTRPEKELLEGLIKPVFALLETDGTKQLEPA